MNPSVVAVVVLMACAVSAQIPAGWTYNPYAYYPYTALPPPVQETPEVAAARANHLAAHAAANGRVLVAHQPVAQPVVYLQPANTIQDTPEVWAAKVEHYKAHQEAAAANGVASSLPSLIPVINYGLPQQVEDTPEVQAAKAEFFRAYNEAAARSG